MLKVIEKDILDVNEGIVVHQVNCRGRMGRGLAHDLREKYPIIYREYMKKYDQYIESGETIPILGTVQIVPISDKLSIANAFTQFNYGYDRFTVYTDYDAIAKVFSHLYRFNIRGSLIHIPYKYGSGNGNGDFGKICEIIERVCPTAIVCKK